MAEADGIFPNQLRARRYSLFLSRAQVAELTEKEAEADPGLYNAVSARTMERLERGEARPQAKSAHALAEVLKCTVQELFPLGLSDQVRNPMGNTFISPDRPFRKRR